MKILILDEEFPYPLNTGKRIRTFNLVSRLAKSNEVYYLACGFADTESYSALKRAGINPVAVPRILSPKTGILFYFRLFKNLFSKYPYIVSSHYSNIFQHGLNRLMEQKPYDLIIAEWTPYAVYLKNVRNFKKIIVAHNIEHRIWERYFETEKNFLKKWYVSRQLKKVREFELSAFKWVDGVTAVSRVEADEIAHLAENLQVEVVENGVDLEYFRPAEEEPDNADMIFVGSMNWRPNQDAIQYFVHDIFPLIKRKINGARAIFVGQDPPPVILKLRSISGIEIIGKVDDVRPYVKKAAVYIVPLRIGGGTRLKILEAMAMKKGIVSTSVGAEGIDIAPEQNILIGDTPDKFASQVVRLMMNKDLRIGLGNAGRVLVEQKYGWDIISQKLERYLRKMAGIV